MCVCFCCHIGQNVWNVSRYAKTLKTKNKKSWLCLVSGPGIYQVVNCGNYGHNIRSRPSMTGSPIGILTKGKKIVATENVRHCILSWCSARYSLRSAVDTVGPLCERQPEWLEQRSFNDRLWWWFLQSQCDGKICKGWGLMEGGFSQCVGVSHSYPLLFTHTHTHIYTHTHTHTYTHTHTHTHSLTHSLTLHTLTHTHSHEHTHTEKNQIRNTFHPTWPVSPHCAWFRWSTSTGRGSSWTTPAVSSTAMLTTKPPKPGPWWWTPTVPSTCSTSLIWPPLPMTPSASTPSPPQKPQDTTSRTMLLLFPLLDTGTLKVMDRVRVQGITRGTACSLFGMLHLICVSARVDRYIVWRLLSWLPEVTYSKLKKVQNNASKLLPSTLLSLLASRWAKTPNANPCYSAVRSSKDQAPIYFADHLQPYLIALSLQTPEHLEFHLSTLSPVVSALSLTGLQLSGKQLPVSVRRASSVSSFQILLKPFAFPRPFLHTSCL